MLTIKRLGTGLSPIYYDLIIGRKAKQLIKKDELLTWEKL
jgi:sialic acid synthase SpsE|tara:strand:- start:79 stop:198 length:120 start_codon:yes stop_codon:yes gene_type:complete